MQSGLLLVLVLSLNVHRTDPALDSRRRNGILYKVRVQVNQLGVGRLRVHYSDEVQGVAFASTTHSNSRVKIKDFLETAEVLRLDRAQPEAHRDRNKHALSLVNFLLDFIEEHIAIVADHHRKVFQRFDRLVEVLEDTADGLGAVPVARLLLILNANLSYLVDSKRCQIAICNVVHEQRQNLVIPQQQLSVNFPIPCILNLNTLMEGTYHSAYTCKNRPGHAARLPNTASSGRFGACNPSRHQTSC